MKAMQFLKTLAAGGLILAGALPAAAQSDEQVDLLEALQIMQATYGDIQVLEVGIYTEQIDDVEVTCWGFSTVEQGELCVNVEGGAVVVLDAPLTEEDDDINDDAEDTADDDSSEDETAADDDATEEDSDTDSADEDETDDADEQDDDSSEVDGEDTPVVEHALTLSQMQAALTSILAAYLDAVITEMSGQMVQENGQIIVSFLFEDGSNATIDPATGEVLSSTVGEDISEDDDSVNDDGENADSEDDDSADDSEQPGEEASDDDAHDDDASTDEEDDAHDDSDGESEENEGGEEESDSADDDNAEDDGGDDSDESADDSDEEDGDDAEND